MEVDSTHYYDNSVTPEINLWRNLLVTYLDDVKYAFQSQQLMDDCQRIRSRPGYFRNKEDKFITIEGTIRQLNHSVEHEWTEFICELANVDYLYFKKVFYGFIKEQQKDGNGFNTE